MYLQRLQRLLLLHAHLLHLIFCQLQLWFLKGQKQRLQQGFASGINNWDPYIKYLVAQGLDALLFQRHLLPVGEQLRPRVLKHRA